MSNSLRGHAVYRLFENLGIQQCVNMTTSTALNLNECLGCTKHNMPYFMKRYCSHEEKGIDLIETPLIAKLINY